MTFVLPRFVFCCKAVVVPCRSSMSSVVLLCLDCSLRCVELCSVRLRQLNSANVLTPVAREDDDFSSNARFCQQHRISTFPKCGGVVSVCCSV